MTACSGPIRAAVGDAFSEEEIDDMVARLAARAKRKGLDNPDLAEAEALRAAAAEMSAEDLREALMKKRMETFAAAARAKRAGRFNVPTPELGKALQDFMVGSSRQNAQVGLSVDGRGRAYADQWRGELVRGLQAIDGALERLNNWMGAADKDFEADVARELGRLNGGKADQSGDPMATQVAKALKDAQDRAMKAMNDRGAFIANLPGYVTRQNHDAIKVSGGFFKGARLTADNAAAAARSWIDKIAPLLDARTFAQTDEIALAKYERVKNQKAKARMKLETRLAAAVDKVNGGGLTDATLKANQTRIAELETMLRGWDDGRLALDELGIKSPRDLIPPAREAFMRQIWNDIVLGKSPPDGEELSDLEGFRPPAGVARQVSKRRVLHFKDPDAWMEYHREYGSGSFFETYLLGLERAARSAALLESWGPNPKAAFDAERARLAERAEKAGDVKAARAIMDGGREREFAVLDGSTDAPLGGGEARAAQVGKVLRIQQSLSKLGGMTLTSLSDMGSAATALVRAGVPLFDAYGDLLGGISRLGGDEAREAGELVGVTVRAIAGDIAGNFSTGDTTVGKLAQLQNVFYKINLFELWQTGVRRGASTALARLLGKNTAIAFEGLEQGLRTGLERFGIDKGLWDLVRRNGDELDPESRNMFLTPDAAGRISPDEAVAWANPQKQMDVAAVRETRTSMKANLELLGYAEQWGDEWPAWTKLPESHRAQLEKVGFTRKLWDRVREAGDLDGVRDRTIAKEAKIADIWSEDQKREAQEEAALRLQAWFSSFVDDALTEPRAAEKAVLTWGQRDGSALGVIMRLLSQFKSFPYTMITRNILPTMHELNGSLAAIRRGEVGNEALGRPAMMAANTIVGLTLLGYLGQATKDLVAGREPRPLDDPKTYLAAFVSGGGAGIYGDLLFAQYNRFGQGPLAALAGPTVGTVEQMLSLYGKLREGKDAGASAQSLAISNIPFLNLFYLRGALNYGLLYQMQEAASPGYLARMEKRMEDMEGRGFWLEPAQLEESRMAD
jgi:hypothetical protein